METPQGQEKEKLNPVLSAITYVFDAAYSVLLTYSQAVLLVIVLIVSAAACSSSPSTCRSSISTRKAAPLA